MKILICTGIYPPDSGGPATYSKFLFDELPKNEIEVEVFSFGASADFKNLESLNLVTKI